ncbi:MAG: AAA family ATPase [Candidatus Omnitrophota bacterium]
MKMNFNWKKIKFFLKLHWIKILLIILGITLGTAIIILLVAGINAWNNAGRFMKQSQLAVIPLQLFLQLIMAIVFGVVYTSLWYYLLFKKGGGGFSQQKKKAIKGEDVKVTWQDVIGMDEAKQEASEVVRLITDRAKLQQIGGSILKGLLLIGPPGCGKTYLAKAIATESQLPFISMSGSEFVEMFVGVGASRIRSLFKHARDLATLEGGCIIFIDEIDAVGAQRAMDRGFGGTTERNTTLNQLLVEMDGLKDKDYNVILVGATNMPESVMDQALLRPGRFDRKIYVDFPSLEDREKLFAYYLKNIKSSQNIKIDKLARLSVGATPADIANIIREASLIAFRSKKVEIDMASIDEARERIALGIKRALKLSPREKLRIAYHEAGHIVVTYLLVPTKDVFKATIIPRGPTGGVTWTPEKEESILKDKNVLLGEIKSRLGGFSSEKIKFGSTSSGVENDFDVSTNFMHKMVWRWGMGNSGLIGNFDEKSGGRLSSFSVSETLNKDEDSILEECLNEVQDLLRKNWDIVEKLANELVKKEELDFDEIDAIFKEFGKERQAIKEPEENI